ncbi:hypothetical protein J2T55_000817 [Methylohalomonas lacus]|uniref:Phasin domain-containing protein n=1 Tax=Methylohalomonas lacus TaxID=398773 RepID=A0AAE3L3V1_9GAMM|nr:phasin family protein [Methylohalomonas lacus]MCS3902813.1 hypothetical protein [Methylohalomonas lacus]
MTTETEKTPDSRNLSNSNNGLDQMLDDYRKFSTNALKIFMDAQIDFMHTCLDCSNDQRHRLMDAKSPEDFINGESDLAEEYMKRFIDSSRKLMDASAKTQEMMFSLWHINDFLPAKDKVETKSLAKRSN